VASDFGSIAAVRPRPPLIYATSSTTSGVPFEPMAHDAYVKVTAA
jgi:hypothetical protein